MKKEEKNDLWYNLGSRLHANISVLSYFKIQGVCPVFFFSIKCALIKINNKLITSIKLEAGREKGKFGLGKCIEKLKKRKNA